MSYWKQIDRQTMYRRCLTGNKQIDEQCTGDVLLETNRQTNNVPVMSYSLSNTSYFTVAVKSLLLRCCFLCTGVMPINLKCVCAASVIIVGSEGGQSDRNNMSIVRLLFHSAGTLQIKLSILAQYKSSSHYYWFRHYIAE